MQQVGIFFFSGTGTTGYVVKKLTLELAQQQLQADVFDIAKTRPSDTTLDGYDAIGIAYPVHAFNAPKIVIDFARQLPGVNGMDAFIISTVGEYAAVNFDSSKYLKRILRQKGFTVFYDKPFTMPCNFIIKDKETKVQDNLNTLHAAMPQTARDIIDRVPQRQPSNLLSKFAAWAGRLEWNGTKSVGKHFYANESCSNCGLCAYSCPNHNISADEKTVRFKQQCGLCMRCIYICPQKAIKVSRPYGFICLDSWYDNEELAIIAEDIPYAEDCLNTYSIL